MRILILLLLITISVSVTSGAPISVINHSRKHTRQSIQSTIKPTSKPNNFNNNNNTNNKDDLPSIVRRIKSTTDKSQALRRSTSLVSYKTGKAHIDRIAPGLDVIKTELDNLTNQLRYFEPVEDEVIAWTVLNQLNKMAIAHKSLLESLNLNYKLVRKLGWRSQTYRTLKALNNSWIKFFDVLSSTLPNQIDHVELVENRSLSALDDALKSFY